MNGSVVVSSLLLLSIVLLSCHSASGRNGVWYTYLFTEDAKPGKFATLPLDNRKRCHDEFFARGHGDGYVNVGRRTGILELKGSLGSLRRDGKGIRRYTLHIFVTNKCYPLNFYRSHPHTTITINLIVFPVNFGDRELLRIPAKRISSRVRQSNTFQRSGTSSNLHRVIRLVSEKVEPRAFNEMMASIKVKKTLEFVINEILRRYVPHSGGKHVYHSWYTNSLFSRSALDRLAKECGCGRQKVVNCEKHARYRTIDGTCNNIHNPLLGSAPTVLNRLLPAKYYDTEGLNQPIGYPGQANVPDMPATFEVVRKFIIEQKTPSPHVYIHSHALMQFGQFLDHDLSLSPESQSSDNCQTARCDGSKSDYASPCYTIQPLGKHRCIHFGRVASQCQIRHGRIIPEEQINVNTAFVDASQIYGSTHEVAESVRNRKNGEMKYARGVLGAYLTTDTRQLMAPTSFCHKFGGCFLAGDNRVNEHMMLASMHIIFSREHNRIARALTKLNPHWNAEIIYQETRKIIGAVLQKITYEDFLPMIIGNTLPPYQGYNPKVHPGILNSFSTAAFRFGHSLIRPTFDRLDANFNPIGDPMPLRHLFFNNTYIKKSGIDEIVLGLLSNSSEAMDTELASGILNNLYERRHSPGLNLAAINIQRSRDHGLPGYNSFRKICGLSDVKSFKDTVHEIPYRHNRRRLAELYNDNPDLADLWAVGLAEAPANGGIVGATFGCIIREQMRRLRDGDRYFYQNHGVFSHRQLHEIKKVTLSKVMCNNLETIVSIQRNAFVSGRRSHRRTECSNIPGIDLTAWRDYDYGHYPEYRH